MTSQVYGDASGRRAEIGLARSAAPSLRHQPSYIRLLVVIEDQLFRESITRALDDVPGLEVVGATAELRSAESYVARTRPSIMVVGPFGTGRMNLAAVRPLVAAAPSCRFVFIVERPTWTTLRQASDTGALGVVPLTAGLAHLVTAIRGAASGYLTVYREALEPVTPPACDLTDRELAILTMTARGLPIKEIADQLFLSAGTVRNNTSKLIKKLGARNRHEAARLAAEQGFL